MKSHVLRLLFFHLVLAGIFGLLAGCKMESASQTDSGSTGGSSKTVRVSWNPSHAAAVAAAGGGYKVYVKKNSPPTASDTTPVTVANPGSGTHVTSATMTLTSGQYYVSVSSYSTNGDSPLSVPYILVVP